MSDKQLCVLLACFEGSKRAAKVRRPLDSNLRSGGDVMLDTVALKVNKKHKASVHDPRRVLLGTLTPALTWGLFGLVANGWVGLLIWAVLGALCGGVYSYYSVHHASKAELAHIGKRLPANSSALLTFAETPDPNGLLSAAVDQTPSIASVAAIADDLHAHVYSSADDPAEARAPTERTVLGMILFRYADVGAAKRAASELAHSKKKEKPAEVELVIETNRNGRRHLHDPRLGVAATVKFDIVSWGLFGVVVGAISGASGGGILKGGVLTGLGWAVFGLVAGALYGLWARRSISARRLKGLGPLLARDSSVLLAWAYERVSQETIDTLSVDDAQRLVLSFKEVDRGAVLEAQ